MDKQILPKEKKQRLFFGVAVTLWLSELTKIQQTLINKLQKLSPNIIWHPIESLHITLVFLGEINNKLRKDIEERVLSQLAEFPIEPFEIKVTKVNLLSSRHIIIAIDAPMLNQLYDQLYSVMPTTNKSKKERAYFAHLALGKLKNTRLAGRVYQELDLIKVNSFQPLLIKEFYLYESKPYRQYIPLTTFSLRARVVEDLNKSEETSIFNKKWEHFSHDADIGVRGWGKSIEEAFEMTAMALTGVITNPNKVKPQEIISVTCSAPDVEILLVDWLNIIIYQIETRQMLFSQFHVEINDLQLTATMQGELINREKHRPVVDVKGATFTELKVQQTNGLWFAQCVLDV